MVDAPRILQQVEALSEAATAVLAAKNAAREAALGRCRDAIRNSANAIRAVHRGDFATAGGVRFASNWRLLRGTPKIYS